MSRPQDRNALVSKTPVRARREWLHAGNGCRRHPARPVHEKVTADSARVCYNLIHMKKQAADQQSFSVRLIQSGSELQEAQKIRMEVFVDEQGIPAEEEIDEWEDRALHVLAFEADTPIATGRIVLEEDKGKLERIAVRPAYRRRGIATAIVRFLEEEGLRRGARRFELTPHVHLEDFYSRLGYRTIGPAGKVAGHPLLLMAREAGPASPASDRQPRT